MDLAGRVAGALAGGAARVGPVHQRCTTRRCSRPRRTPTEAGLTGSFAAFSLYDREVHDRPGRGARSWGSRTCRWRCSRTRSGHHVLCPADLADNGRLLRPGPARAARAGGARADDPEHVRRPADQRPAAAQRGLRMAEVYRRARDGRRDDPLWTFYQRIFEILWALPAGTLAAGRGRRRHGGRRAARREAGAGVRDRLARPARAGSPRCACGTWSRRSRRRPSGCGGCCASAWSTRTRRSRASTRVDDGGEVAASRAGPAGQRVRGRADPAPRRRDAAGRPASQYREPFEYGQLLRAAGAGPVARRRWPRGTTASGRCRTWCRSRCADGTPSTEPLPEGLGAWDVGEPLEAVDWLATHAAVAGRGAGHDDRAAADRHGRGRRPRRAAGGPGHLRGLVGLDAEPGVARVVPDAGRRDPRAVGAAGGRAGAGDAVERHQASSRAPTASCGTSGRCWASSPAISVARRRSRCTCCATPTRDRDRPTHIVVISDDGVDTMFRPTDERGTAGCRDRGGRAGGGGRGRNPVAAPARRDDAAEDRGDGAGLGRAPGDELGRAGRRSRPRSAGGPTRGARDDRGGRVPADPQAGRHTARTSSPTRRRWRCPAVVSDVLLMAGGTALDAAAAARFEVERAEVAAAGAGDVLAGGRSRRCWRAAPRSAVEVAVSTASCSRCRCWWTR